MDPTKIKYYISNNKLSFLDDYGQTLFSLDRKDGASAQSIYGTWGLSETQGNITCDSYYQFNTNSTLLKVNCNEK